MPRILASLALVACLSGCAGLNRAAAVLPNTLDGLGGRGAPVSQATPPAPQPPPGPRQPGDAALAVRP